MNRSANSSASTPGISLTSLTRQRANKVRDQARCIAHMQKALPQMNIQLDQTISDIAGKTEMKILWPIIAGERDSHVLARRPSPPVPLVGSDSTICTNIA